MSKHPIRVPSLIAPFQRGLKVDRSAQASFAVVAVLLLVLSGVSYLVISHEECRTDGMQLDRDTLRRMSECASSVASELDEEAYGVALEACGGVQALNSTLLDQRFSDLWAERTASSFPEVRGGFMVDMASSALHLDFLRLTQDDSSGAFTGEGELEWRVEGTPSYFSLDGNYTLQVGNSIDSLTVYRRVERHVYVPLPLLLDKAAEFESSVVGSKNRLENIVRYELASLVQWRSLNGYGAASIMGDQGTTVLLTEDDVRRALSLATMILEVECFGALDPVSSGMALSDFPVPFTVDELLGEIRDKGEFDPADLFLALNGAFGIDLGMVMAQTLFSVADLLVLRWLEFFHVIDIAKALEGLVSDVTLTLNDILGQLTGEDRVMESVQAWMSGRLADAGYAEETYRWMNYGPTDASILVPTREMELTRRDGTSYRIVLEGYRLLDFPSTDIYALECWKDFVVEFKQGTCELALRLQSFIRSLASGIADGSNLPPLTLRLDPFDGRSLMDEVEDGLLSTLSEKDIWFDSAVIEARDRLDLKDPLGEAMVQFVQGQWKEIFRMNQSVDYALDELAVAMMEEAIGGLEDFDGYLCQAYTGMLAYAMKTDESWGLREEVEEAFSLNPLRRVDIFSEVFGNVTYSGMPQPLGAALLNLAQGLIDGVPGVKATLLDACQRMLRDSSQASGLRTDRILAKASSDVLVLSLGGTTRAHERLVPRVEMPWVNEPSLLDAVIDLPLPSPGKDGMTNLHLTKPGNISFAAYQAAFHVSVGATLRLTLGCVGDLSCLASVPSGQGVKKELDLQFDTALTCTTSWPLQGVEYPPSTTLLSELGEFFNTLWEGITAAFDWLADAANSLFSLLQELLSTLASYAMQAIQTISDFLMSIVEGIKDLVDGAIGALIGWLGETVVEKIGATTFTLEFGCLSFIFEFAAGDIFLGRSKEYLRVTMRTDLLGAGITVGARFVDIYRQGPDLIANISLVGGGWRAECVIDPRMMVMDHFVEVRGVFQDFILELSMPVLVAFEKRSILLSDVPGLGQLLSNIPVPIPGLTASIDAGFEVKYNSPFATHVVINEVELNPPGADQGHEWVELYNPANEAVQLDGWTLRTAHGVQSISQIDGELIGPKSHLIVEFPGQSLDNGGEAGYPLGEAVALLDPAGRKVDSMPFLTDYYNDARTWQRTFDASDRWEFKNATKDGTNGFMMVDYNDMDLWEKALMDAVLRAFVEMGKAVFDLGSLAELIKKTIMEVVETVIRTIARSIVEMSLFVEVALQDYSRTFDGRLRLALVIAGEGVRDALLWIADAVACALSNLLNPTAVVTRAHSIHEILDDVYIRFGAFGAMGMPKLLSSVVGDHRFQFGAQVEMNLATIVAPPKGPRNWTVNFGVLFKEVPGALLRTLYPVDADKLVDCWVLRASVHSLRPEEHAALDKWSL